eukprot:351397-Chlamydomonas_euryale.AAC.3
MRNLHAPASATGGLSVNLVPSVDATYRRMAPMSLSSHSTFTSSSAPKPPGCDMRQGSFKTEGAACSPSPAAYVASYAPGMEAHVCTQSHRLTCMHA